MRKEVDIETGQSWIHRTKEEVVIGFLAECIEGLADTNNCGYAEMLTRLEKQNLTEGYILKHYDALHTESMENILEELNNILQEREISEIS